MVKLSTKSRYGTRLVLDMARYYGEGPVQLADIAARQQVSVKYLEQIVIPLKRAGIVESLRGARGGHFLLVDPREITVGRIVCLLEGDQWLVHCTNDPGSCDRASSCVTRIVWQEAADAMLQKLSSYTFQDLLDMEDALASEKAGSQVQTRDKGPFRESAECGCA
ncbi:MAG: Rrf2 family transcriptional regulator [Desulfacinum sp.]|jgi:Rrf2 family protein|nr:Rrf2 family transcriptional regulator [Desulfacinum sp.]